jgi:hypothetical protein
VAIFGIEVWPEPRRRGNRQGRDRVMQQRVIPGRRHRFARSANPMASNPESRSRFAVLDSGFAPKSRAPE